MLTKTSLEFLKHRFSAQSVMRIKTHLPSNKHPQILKYEKSDIFESLYSKDFLKKRESEIRRTIKRLFKGEEDAYGGFAKFFKIPGTDYGLRVEYINDYNFNSKMSTKLTVTDRKNQIKAKFGKHIQIMNLVEGKNAVVQYIEGQKPIIKEKQIALNEKLLAFPISAYTDIIKQVLDAAKNNLEYDSIGKNIMANLAKKRFTIIDFKTNHSITQINPIELFQEGFHAYTNAQRQMFLKRTILGYAKLLKPENNLPVSASILKPSVNEELCVISEENLKYLNNKLEQITMKRIRFEKTPCEESAYLLKKEIYEIKQYFKSKAQSCQIQKIPQ